MKLFYYSTILIVILVTAFLAFFVIRLFFIPAQKPVSKLSLAEVGGGDANSGIQWVADAHSMNYFSGSGNKADLLFFRDQKSFLNENFTEISGKVLFFEQLFSQVSESQYDRTRLEYLTGVNYSGFSGATYEDLGDRSNLPEKVVALYESSTGMPWNYFGEGIVLSDETTVIVLRRGIDYSGSMQLLAENKKINYQGIFEITESNENTLASFSIPLKAAGKMIFEKFGLPSTFSAAYKIERNLYEAYYLAGNFSAVQIPLHPASAQLASLMRNKLIYSSFTNEEVYWRWYYPFLEQIIETDSEKKGSNQELVSIKLPEKTVSFSVSAREIFITDSESTRSFFIKGVNLGAALPGRYFTEFPDDKKVYLQWFKDISGLNVNTIRIYTLLPPVFYQALFEYNHQNVKPLYLLQEIWPEEHPQNSNLLDEAYNDAYHQEIEYVVHAIHGNIQVPTRSYRSYGVYAYDVSPYLLGYLVGRELEPEEVLETDRINEGSSFKGDYFYSFEGASPSESWLAASCDYAMLVEESNYHNKPLIGIVSWPTLDPLVHPSEWVVENVEPFNDKAVVNINHIGVETEKVSGFFGAYHIYPNYPDFMNNETAYAAYEDDQGSFNYGGYLQEFMKQHTRYPAVIAEYGISTSSLTAHLNPDGLNHGGLSETQQAEGIIRMTETIRREEYSGAIIFEWMDEWAKKTWTTEYYMIPYDRHVFWHNVIDPEQNYGLMAYKVSDPELSQVYSAAEPKGQIENVSVGQNEEYIEIQLTCTIECREIQPVSLAISTYEEAGEPQPVWEFYVNIDDHPQLLVNPGYNWLKGAFASALTDFSEFEPLTVVTNAGYLLEDGSLAPELSQNYGALQIGGFLNNENQVSFDGNVLKIRLPYSLIGFSDPSSKTILFDKKVFVPSAIDQIGVRQTDALLLRVIPSEGKPIEVQYPLSEWELPQYSSRLKDSFESLTEYFGNLK